MERLGVEQEKFLREGKIDLGLYIRYSNFPKYSGLTYFYASRGLIDGDITFSPIGNGSYDVAIRII